MNRDSEIKKIIKFLNLEKKQLKHLQSLDELTFLKLLSPIILLSYIHGKLNSIEDSIILTTFYISTIEVLQSVKSGKVYKKNKLVETFFKENLNNEQKMSLLRSFTFSDGYEFKKLDFVSHHLMREDYINSLQKYEVFDKYCTSGSFVECECVRWLRDNIDKVDLYIPKLSKHFYNMRNSVLHDGSGVLWFHDFQYNNGGVSSGTLFDAYSTSYKQETKFISYGSSMPKEEFYSIMKEAIVNFTLSF